MTARRLGVGGGPVSVAGRLVASGRDRARGTVSRARWEPVSGVARITGEEGVRQGGASVALARQKGRRDGGGPGGRPHSQERHPPHAEIDGTKGAAKPCLRSHSDCRRVGRLLGRSGCHPGTTSGRTFTRTAPMGPAAPERTSASCPTPGQRSFVDGLTSWRKGTILRSD